MKKSVGMSLNIVEEMSQYFGNETYLTIGCKIQLLKLGLSGSINYPPIRALCWRIYLGILSSTDRNIWPIEIEEQCSMYIKLKNHTMTSLDQVTIDPLTAHMLTNNNTTSNNTIDSNTNNEWNKYYKNVELTNFIVKDLDRLFITGIDESYFQTKERRNMLLSILLVWSDQHPVNSYRQGMHEIAGYILYCLEIEANAWNEINNNTNNDYVNNEKNNELQSVFNMDKIEASTYHLFNRIMNELEPLYDPNSIQTNRGFNKIPFITQYCVKIQEHYLNMLDPELCLHLEHENISAQLYGIRWSRMLLGREFSVDNHQLFYIWDYIFACCYEAENFSNEDLLDEDLPPNINSVLASVRIAGHNQYSNQDRRNISSLGIATVAMDSSPQTLSAIPAYVCTPLLGALADVMLAMLIMIRLELLSSESSSLLALLMRYPQPDSVVEIIQYADMIKRGIMIHHSSSLPPYYSSSNNVNMDYATANSTKETSIRNNNSNSTTATGAITGGSWFQQLKVGEKLLAVSSAVGGMVSNMVDLSHGGGGVGVAGENQSLNNHEESHSYSMEHSNPMAQNRIRDDKYNISSKNKVSTEQTNNSNNSYKHTGSFKSSTWLTPSSSKKAAASISKHNNNSYRNNRRSDSTGFDLHVLKSAILTEPSIENSNNNNDDNIDPIAMNNNLIERTSIPCIDVSDRLLDIADQLSLFVVPSYPIFTANDIDTNIHQHTIDALINVNHQNELNIKNAIKKIRILADVLVGISSIETYDDLLITTNHQINDVTNNDIDANLSSSSRVNHMIEIHGNDYVFDDDQSDNNSDGSSIPIVEL